jgi:glutathione synthase/RimK-type ligase-like ATP-grasp enzyme
LHNYEAFLWKKQNQFAAEPAEYNIQGSPFTAGILTDQRQYHRHWIGACRDLGISYRLIHLAKKDWYEQIASADCHIFLVWPDVSSVETKAMFDERLNIMVHQMNRLIYPSLAETYLFENKRVQNYWMKAKQLPFPKTWIFYNREEAIDFTRTCSFPIIFKCNLGASSNGVFLLESNRSAYKMIERAFKRGICLKRGNIYDRQRRNVYFQEYLPDVKEWRMARIGESYFGHGKEKVGLFHSGSHKVNWNLPPKSAFELLRTITDIGGFTSMNVDLFETLDGQLLVNELQTVFGTSIAGEQLKINDQPGRYVYVDDTWQFEPGSYCANHMCNLRLQYVYDQLIHTIKKSQ